MTSNGILAKFASLRDGYNKLRSAGRDSFSVCFDRVISPHEAILGGRRVIVLGTNNYLGLTFDPRCIEQAVAAVREAGTGTTGSRIANGTYGGHAELERRLAHFFGRRSAMLFTTGYQANLGMLATLAGRDDFILIDADSHASIYDGCRLSAAQVIRFRHNDPEDLAHRLHRLKDQPGSKLVVVEGIYSILGDIPPLREIAEVKRRAGAYLLLDEAHSLGVLGPRGRGLAEEAGVESEIDFIVGTMSKSLGAIGGFCVSDLPDFDVLRVACRAYMFTASLPPSIVASSLQALTLIEQEPQLRQRLHDSARRLHGLLKDAGFSLGAPPGPIISLLMPDIEQAVTFWNRLIASGVYMNLALPPATPGHYPLLRSSVSAALTAEQLETAAQTVIAVGQSLGVIPAAAAPTLIVNAGKTATADAAPPATDAAAATQTDQAVGRRDARSSKGYSGRRS